MTGMGANSIGGSLTWERVVHTFVPFAVLLVVAMWAAEATLELTRYRAIYAVWVSLVFAIPALHLFVRGDPSTGARSYWLLCWTFSYLAYLVHFSFAVFGLYGGSLAAMYAKQGPLIATSNLVVTVLWTADVVLAWVSDRRAPWIRAERVAAHAAVALTFFVSGVLIFGGFARVLGLLLTAAVAWGLLRRVHLRPTEAVRP